MDLSYITSMFLLEESGGRSNTEIFLCSVISSGLVGLSGILPLLVIPVETGKRLKHGAAASRLKLLLSFAAGSILGDVFLHLLPEAWTESKSCGSNLGLGILVGILTFFIIEKIFTDDDDAETPQITVQSKCEQNGHNGTTIDSGLVKRHTAVQNGDSHNGEIHKPSIHHVQQYQMRGYLNLMANVIDNFTHGMAVGASFSVSRKVGLLTTFAILVHEIPHEVGDFAILLRAGFSRWDAAGAQAMTASGGMIGAMAALSAGSLGNFTAWILSFTSGGFIYIAMVTVLPDLLKERNQRESFKQVLGLCFGICVMGLVNGVAG